MVEKGIFLVYNKSVVLILRRERRKKPWRIGTAPQGRSAPLWPFTLLGKVMGLYRDHLLAVHYGMGMEANAFYTASRIPRVFFDAVFASAIAACFIPVFSEYLEQKGKKEAYRFAVALLPSSPCSPAFLPWRGWPFPSRWWPSLPTMRTHRLRPWQFL